LYQDTPSKHTAIVPPTAGHHWQDAYTTTGGQRVPLRVLVHRPLPEEGILKRLALLGTHEPAFGTWDWQFQCTVEIPPPVPSVPTGRALGLDVGWRVCDTGLRVAVVTDGRYAWELRVPWDMAGANLRRRQRHYARYGAVPETTGSWRELWQRQHEMDLCLETCKAILASCDQTTWPVEARVAMGQLVKMRASGLRRLRQTLAAAGIIVAALDDWAATHAVAWRRMRASQLHLLRARTHLYRHFADWVARHADVVSWEGDLGLKALAEADVRGAYALDAARKYRQMAGLHTLRTSVREALATRGRTRLDAPAAYTTQTCAVCGAPIPPTPHLEGQCANGHWEDQDVNAATVLWRDIPEAQRPLPPAPLLVDRAQLARGLTRLA
jgi:putative transposase